MTDYRKLIDAETWAFIERTNAYYPPDATDYVAKQRAVYDRMCREFFAGYPEGVTADTFAIDTRTHSIPVRLYRRLNPDASATVLYFHGGGFILGGLDSHDDVCAELCARTGYDVVSVGLSAGAGASASGGFRRCDERIRMGDRDTRDADPALWRQRGR